MRIWWILFITVHLVCGKSEIFKEINESEIKRETSINNDDQEDVKKNLMLYPDNNLTRRKRSLEGEERSKRQQKFHSWGGKRYTDKDEDDKVEGAEESNKLEYNGIETGTDIMNQSTPRSYVQEENIFLKTQNQDLFQDITEEDKREPEVIYDVRKRAQLPDSILQQFGFRPELSEQNSKRYPAFNSWAGKRSAAFNSWGGKRAPFNSWGGKRAASFNSWGGKRAAPFNSWGGKRAASFNSWGGKRAASFNSWGGKRSASFNSWGGKRNEAYKRGDKHDTAFNSWGGKRAKTFNSWKGKKDAAFNSWGGKRDAAFNSWGGKRAVQSKNPRAMEMASFNSWGGKRNAAFNSWGGKRAAPFNSWGGKRAAAFNSWGGKRDLEGLDNLEREESVRNKENIDDDKSYIENSNFIDDIPKEEDYDATNTMNNDFNDINGKRSSAFNSWGGKRMPALDSWVDKRIVAMNNPGGKKSAAFNSWGGKRATGTTSFNSWGGKRSASFNTWDGNINHGISSDQDPLPDNPEEEEDTSTHNMIDETFASDEHGSQPQTMGIKSNNELINNLASQRHVTPGFDIDLHKVNLPGIEHPWNNIKLENGLRDNEVNFGMPDNVPGEQMKKRSNPAFSSWAGKRAPLFTPWYANKMPSLLISSGKRRPAFSSWGGKRSELKPLQEFDCSNLNECPYLEKTHLSEENQDNNRFRGKREVNCNSKDSNSSSDGSGEKGCRDKKLEGNFKKSKGRVMARMLFQGGILRPMEIKSLSRGLDFYAWGGKRSL